MKICLIREGIRRKLWKGSGTGSTQLVSGILLLFLRKLNNTLWVLKCRNMEEKIACKCAFRLKWRNTWFSTSLSEGNDVRWIFQMLKWQRNGKGTMQSEKEESVENRLLLLFQILQRTWARIRKRYGCWRLICVWRKWRERRGRNHPTGRKRPVEVMAGVGGAGSRLLSDGCLLRARMDSHTYMLLQQHRSAHFHTPINQGLKKTLHAALSWTYYLFHICFSKEHNFYFKDKLNGAPGFGCVQ